MISGVDSLMPLTHLSHSPPPITPPATLCSLYLRVSYDLSPSLFLYCFASLTLCSSVLSLKVLIWVKSYDFSFSDWLISLSIIPSSSIHEVANGKISFFFDCRAILHCIYIPHLLYPFIHRWTFGLFHTLAIVDSAAINMGVNVSLWNSTPASCG